MALQVWVWNDSGTDKVALNSAQKVWVCATCPCAPPPGPAIPTGLYICGNFSTVNGTGGYNSVAWWDGAAWQNPDSGLSGQAHCLEIWDGKLIAVGAFSGGGSAVPFACDNVGYWDGVKWNAMNNGVTPGPVYGAANVNGDLYICGDISFLNGLGTACHGVAWWDGSQWVAVGNSGLSQGGGPVYAFAAIASYLDLPVVGGSYSSGGHTLPEVKIWSGGVWSAVGTWPGTLTDGEVSRLVIFNGILHAVGYFKFNGGTTHTEVMQLNGSTWQVIATTASVYSNNQGFSGTPYNGTIVICGFNVDNPDIATNVSVAEANSGSFTNYISGSDITSTMYHVVQYGADLIAGGTHIPLNFLAKWNGSSWSTFQGGTNGNVNFMVVKL